MLKYSYYLKRRVDFLCYLVLFPLVLHGAKVRRTSKIQLEEVTMGLGQVLLCTRHMSRFCSVFFFAESLTATHPGGSEVEGSF